MYDLTVPALIIKGVIQVKGNVVPVRKNLINKMYIGRGGKVPILLDHSTERRKRCGLNVVLKNFKFIDQLFLFSGSSLAFGTTALPISLVARSIGQQ
jgi:hypothetical protein